MEAQEHNVRPAAELQHMGAEHLGALVLPAPPDGLQIRGRALNFRVGAQAVLRVKEGFRVLRDLLHPQKQID